MKLFTRKTLVFLLVIGVGTFVVGLLLTAHTGSIFERATPGSSSFSRSLVGHHALAEFLRQSGVTVLVVRNQALLNKSRTFPLLLLEPVPPGADLRIEDVSQHARVRRMIRNANRSEAPVVAALPKWRVEPAQTIPGWISSQHLLPQRGVEKLLWTIMTAEDENAPEPPEEDLIVRKPSIHNPRADLPGISHPGLDLPDPVQVLAPRENLKPLLSCDEGVLIGRLESGDVLISDPDLYNNRGLGRGDHAVILMSLIVDLLSTSGVVMDESLHGFSSQGSIMQRALSFPLVLVSLHVLLLLLLLAWSLSVRFGAPVPPPPELEPGKEILIDNTARLLQWAGDHANAYRRYLQINMADVARRYILVDRGWFDERELLPNLQQVTKARGLAVDLAKLESATRSDSLSPMEAVRLARRIHAWRRALLGASGKEDS